MKKTYLLVVSFTLSSFLSFGQCKDFDLSTYKLPDLKRSQLDLEFNLGGHSWKFIDEDDQDQTLSELDFKINPNWNYYRNSEHWQIEQDFWGFYQYSNEDNENEWRDYSQKRRNISVYWTSENRYYFNSKTFLELDANVNYSRNKTRDKDVEDIMNESNGFNISMPFSIGRGRIDQVQDARLALYILEEMEKTGSLKKEPTKEEVLYLASQLSSIKNKRIFDFREKMKYELVATDSVLKKMGLVEDSDGPYFSGLYDNLKYAEFPIRRSGSRWSVGVTSSYMKNDWERQVNDISQIETSSTRKGLYGTLDYTKEKPLNLKWQSSFSVGIRYGKEKRELENDGNDVGEEELDFSNFQGRFNYQLGYFPNTRTSLHIGINGSYDRSQGDEKARYIFEWVEEALLNHDFEHNLLLGELYSGFYYYISRQVQLRGDYSLFYRKYDSDSILLAGDLDSDRREWRHRFTLALVLKIF